MVIFNSYVKLPEGNGVKIESFPPEQMMTHGASSWHWWKFARFGWII
jgi:hypothetical protein